jgi:hypothetical protein
MQEYSKDSFANRGDALPLISKDIDADLSDEELDDQSTEDGKHQEPRHGISRYLSTSAIKDKARKVSGKVTGKAAEKGSSMQDRLLERLLQQVIPIEDQSQNRQSESSSAAQSYTERPGFNITTMSTNFRRFNARIGVVFVFQANVVKLLSWDTWSHTLSFLAVYTLICLDPSLLSVVPLVVLLLALFIPSFIARHPAPPATSTPAYAYSMMGPPIAPAPTVKPVKEMSKDFLRNMRDLQNSMEDFSRLHDRVVSKIGPPTNFSDEALSTTLFLFLAVAAAAMFLASHLVPWHLIFLIGGWFATLASHPRLQKILVHAHKEHVVPREKQLKTLLDSWVAHDVILDSEPETREVEIFELQKLSNGGEWESWIFSPSPYDPLSPARIANERPKGTRFFEDVQAPKGWEWSEKKWTLDLWSREWVEERIITGVEIETEGERWVYDIEYDQRGSASSSEPAPRAKGPAKNLPSWEENEGGYRERGEWRRRRWVRMVKRRMLSAED